MKRIIVLGIIVFLVLIVVGYTSAEQKYSKGYGVETWIVGDKLTIKTDDCEFTVKKLPKEFTREESFAFHCWNSILSVYLVEDMEVKDKIKAVEKIQGFVEELAKRIKTGKMEFKSLLLEKYSESFGYDALPVYRPPKYSHEATPDMAKDYPFILNTGTRLPMFIGSQTFRLPWTRSLGPEPSADLNLDDCLRLGIEPGDDIKISTPKGSIVVKANINF